METKDAVLLEVLARSSQRDGFLKMAAAPELVASVRARYEQAEAALQDATVGAGYHDREARRAWQILYVPGMGLGLAAAGGGSFEHWTTKPDAVLLEAFTSLPEFELVIDRHRRSSSSALLQAGAAAVFATGEDLPLLPSAPAPASDVSPEEADEILASASSSEEDEAPEDTAAIVEAIVDAVPVRTEPVPVPAVLSEESRLAEELLGKLGTGNADLLTAAPLPALKGAEKAHKARASARKRGK